MSDPFNLQALSCLLARSRSLLKTAQTIYYFFNSLFTLSLSLSLSLSTVFLTEISTLTNTTIHTPSPSPSPSPSPALFLKRILSLHRPATPFSPGNTCLTGSLHRHIIEHINWIFNTAKPFISTFSPPILVSMSLNSNVLDSVKMYNKLMVGRTSIVVCIQMP